MHGQQAGQAINILIIGAGVGGATAAALLAKRGHQVTVLEAHTYPGGCAGTFFHQGYRFDAGATLAGGFQPGGPHAMVGEELGLTWQVTRCDPAWRVHLPDRAVTRYSDPACWRAEVARAFPESAPAVQRFNHGLESAADVAWAFASRCPPWPPQRAADLVRLAAGLRPAMIPLAPHLLEPMAAWAARSGVTHRAPRAFIDAQLLISAQATASTTNALFGAAALDLPRKGVNHVAGGIGTLSRQLVTAARANGALVKYRREVVSLEVRDGRVVAALTADGERHACDACIANLTPWGLQKVLGTAAPPSLAHETARRGDQWGAFVLYLGVRDEPAHEQPTDPVHHHQVVDAYDAPLAEINSVFISHSRRGDDLRAPVGHRAITISTHTRSADWWRLRDDPARATEYADRVAEYTERMLRLAERALPGLRARIAVRLPGTPVTFSTYTRRHHGGVGGFPFTSIFGTRGPGTGVRNLWLVGDSIFPGQSTAGVTFGALRVADEVARAANIQPLSPHH